MIGSFGVLTTGVTPKRIDDIISQLQASLVGDLGASFSLLSQTPEGQLVNRFAEQVADLWEFGEQAYNANYPDTAQGTSLDNARSLTNNFRIPATASVVNGVFIQGTPGVVIGAGFQVSVAGSPGSVFQIAQAMTIPGGGLITDASFVCLATGPVDAPVNALNVIVTPVLGVTFVGNPTAAELGTNVETDAAFRVRSAQELNKAGTGTFSGLLAAVQAVTNVSKAYEFLNDLNVVDANGLAPHSVLLVVVGGVDQDIRDAIFAAKGAGIETNGTTSGTVVDSQGNAHTVKFSRLTDTPIYMDVTITPNNDPALGPVYPANGDDLVQAAIVAFGAGYRPGQTVVVTGFFTPINSISGVTDAVIKVSTAPSPTLSANIPIPIDQLATFALANVVVHQ